MHVTRPTELIFLGDTNRDVVSYFNQATELADGTIKGDDTGFFSNGNFRTVIADNIDEAKEKMVIMIKDRLDSIFSGNTGYSIKHFAFRFKFNETDKDGSFWPRLGRYGGFVYLNKELEDVE